MKKFFSILPLLSLVFLYLGCANKTFEKEIRIPGLYETKEQAEKAASKFGCKGSHKMGDKWMPCNMHKH